jgi:HPr kinase/phosphorylase
VLFVRAATMDGGHSRQMTERTQPAGVTVSRILTAARESATAAIDLEVLAGHSGLERLIVDAHPQKTGLALSGFDGYLHGGRVLVFGESEIRYLETMTPEDRGRVLQRVLARDLPCVVITQAFEPPPELIAATNAAAVPLLRTRVTTPDAMSRMALLLDIFLAPRTMVHGVLMDILGLGVLVIGESGIGKSECALDLVVRGHRLVADDAVELRCRADSFVLGTCPELTRHHMEIRGLGLINVQDLFGVASTRTSQRVELVVQLERWEPGREYDRLGLDDQFFEVLNVRIPMIRMPVAPGRNVAILVEVAARNQLLRLYGHHAARRLVSRLNEALETSTRPPHVDFDRGEDI